MCGEKNIRRKRLILWAKCLISLGFLLILFLSVDLGELQQNFREMNPFYALAGVVLSFAMVGASTWKWYALLKMQGVPLPFLDLYRWYFVGYFYSNFLPSNVGGDVARSWLAGKKTGSHSAAVISIFVERFTGLIFLLLMAVFLPFLKPGLLRLPSLWIGSALGVCGLIIIGILMFLGTRSGEMKILHRPLGFFKRVLNADQPGKTADLWESIVSKLKTIRGKLGELWLVLCQSPKALFQVVALTVLYYVLLILNVLLAFRTFGVWPDAEGVAAVLPVALMVAMIPVSLGGWGITEGAFVYYFGLVGMDGGLTLAMGIFLRLKILLLGLIGLVIHLKEPVEIKS